MNSHIVDDGAATAGAQSLRRALQLLRILAREPEQGLSLTSIIAECGLTRSTVHRLLSCLVEEGFAERSDTSRHYRLGIDAMQLGFASMRGAALVGACRPVMKKLARIGGDTVFLLVRQGDHSVCLHREEGHYPVKVFTTDIGERRLLGIGAGGLALMATLSDQEITRIVQRNAAEYAKAGFTLASVRAAVKRTREAGHAEITETVTRGVSGVGRTFLPSPSTLAAMSIGAISSRLPPARRKELARLLADQLSGALAGA